VVLLDEAHRLRPEAGEALLNVSQEVTGEAPFLLCLAGTPGIVAHLNRMHATFVERSEELRIRLLDRAGSEAALGEPLRASELSIAKEALAAVVESSQGYPYFLQVWGKELVRAVTARRRGRRITKETVAAARTAFEAAQQRFYSNRCAELERSGLLPAAEAVARAFEERRTPVMGRRVLRKVLRRAGLAEDAARGLEDRGFVWVALHPAYLAKWETNDLWEPGIPSLMGHVLRQREIEVGASSTTRG